MRAMKADRRKRGGAMLAALFLLCSLLAPLSSMAQVGYTAQYTYTYDYWGGARASPDAYRVKTVLTSAGLGLVNTSWAVILPAFAAPIGLFLMKQFMEGIPMALIESAKMDGASELRIFWQIVMPNVKPAWLTLIIFSVQGLWNAKASTVIYSEAKKTLTYALQQIQAGGIARAGQAAAVTVIMMLVPITIFILSQTQILETMASSGIKE